MAHAPARSDARREDRKSTRLNSSHSQISYAVFCLKKKKPDIEAARKKRDEIEAGKRYSSRRFGCSTYYDESAQLYARLDKNDWRIQAAEFDRFHDEEVKTFGYF